jgi:hypothetical protein
MFPINKAFVRPSFWKTQARISDAVFFSRLSRLILLSLIWMRCSTNSLQNQFDSEPIPWSGTLPVFLEFWHVSLISRKFEQLQGIRITNSLGRWACENLALIKQFYSLTRQQSDRLWIVLLVRVIPRGSGNLRITDSTLGVSFEFRIAKTFEGVLAFTQ